MVPGVILSLSRVVSVFVASLSRNVLVDSVPPQRCRV